MAEALPSFAEFARQQTDDSPYLTQLPPGQYQVQFLGAEMVRNKFNNVVPRYRFNHNGTEKSLESGSRKLLALSGKEGQTVVLVKSLSHDGKTQWAVR